MFNLSDIQISTSWSSINDNVKDYSTSSYLYFENEDGVFLGGILQNAPSEGVAVPSTYIKGLGKNTGYETPFTHTSSGDTVTSDTISEVICSMILDNNDYSNCRIYLQFRNTYGVTLKNCSVLLYDTEDTLLATLGSSIEISADGELEVSFINDYDREHVKIVISGEYATTTYPSGDITLDGKWLYVAPNSSNYYWSNTIEVTNNSDYPCWWTIVKNYMVVCSLSKSSFSVTVTGAGSFTYVIYNNYYYGYKYYFGTNMDRLAAIIGGDQYNSTSTAIDDFYSNVSPTDTGVTTTGLNTYSGTLYEINSFANIENVFPGKTNTVEGGTEGTFDDTTDTVALPSLPTTDQVLIDDGKSVNAFSLFLLSSNGYRYVRQCLFSTDFFTNIKNYFTKPLDGIVAVGRFPFIPPTSHPGYPIYIGSVALEYNNTIAVGDAINRYQTYDCGSIQILPYWDTALDYNPYTQVIINLPFIGRKQLNTDLVMGKTIHVIYHIDMVTGGCIAYILADDDLIEQFTGNMMTVAPLSGEDFSRVYGALLTSVASSSVSAFGSGSPGTALAGAVTGVANTALHSKRDFSGNTNLGGSTSLMENLQPFVEIIRPVQSRPRNYKKFKGYVSTVTELLSNCSGYTEVIDIHLDNIPATDTEKDEISALLHSGVII